MTTNLLGDARRKKTDEFYTQLSDIEKELYHYREQFRGKIVFCNCDDPYESNFFKYFALNFNFLGLKKLIATCYSGSPVLGQQLSLLDISNLNQVFAENKQPYKIEITEVYDENADGAVDLSDVEYLLKNRRNLLTFLEGDGDFRSAECIELLKEADVVVTNPPFSLFREFISQLIDYNKQFLVLGSQNAITYKEVFRLIKDNRLWLGYDNGGIKWFQVPMDYEIQTASRIKIVEGVKYFSMGSVFWYTNLDTTKRHEFLTPYKDYSTEDFLHFDNYDAINIDRVSDIPDKYFGIMGVPITFIDKYNPEQFEIIGLIAGNIRGVSGIPSKTGKEGPYIHGKLKYGRVLVQRKEKRNED